MRIGYLTSGAAPSPTQLAALRDGMKENGFTDPDYTLEVRAADGKSDALVSLAQEIVALGPDMILAVTTGATQAARAATSTVPIVMVAAHDPVEAGVVADLAKPGGNVTGQSLMGGDLMPKQLEILREVAAVQRLAYLTPHVPSPGAAYPSVTDIFERSMREKASLAGIDVTKLVMRLPGDINPIVAALDAEKFDAIYLIESPTWTVPPSQRPIDRVVEAATRRRLPSIVGARFFVQAGLLMSYGDARTEIERFRTVARYVARIRNGAKPASLPVERPTRFDLVLNLKAAGVMGVTFPRSLLDRADAVLQ